MNQLGVPLLACVVISVGLSIIVGLLIERLAYRPLRDSTEETTLISSLAVSSLLQNLLQMVFGSQRKPFMLPDWLTQSHKIGAVSLSTINSFQCFALIQLLTSGGSGTNTVMYYIYYTAFKLTEQSGHFGYANAMGVVLAIFIGLLSALQFKLAKEK